MAYKAAVAFEKNQNIDVYYDPFYPQRSALDIKIPAKLNAIIAFVLFLILLHLGIVAYQIVSA